ncbi:MAG: class I SAM-dependent methyltransferase [Actinomycetota bacterium]|nr:class I SAM-dependent methyltransferase [Actinomycetota bacterium]
MDAGAWDARYAEFGRVWSVEPNQFVAAELAELPAGRAVDLAAGEGRNAIWLASRGWDVTAIDFSSVAIDRARAVSDDVAWVVGDTLTVPLPGQLDLALISYLQLPHDEMETVVRRAYDALAPGGTFFLICHDASNIAEGVGGPQQAEVLVDAGDVTGWLGPGARVVRADRVERHVEAGTAYDVLVRAVRA